MTKSRQDFHSNAEEFAHNFRRRAAEMLKLRENLPVFNPLRVKIWPKKGQTFNFLTAMVLWAYLYDHPILA